MQTIQACVNPRLLKKADRLFTGSLEGRVIEILQNARRAGATKVVIGNADGFVTVRDNGEGIEDFSRLLDLGGIGWEEALESSEDPAGVGIFCLAPREATIRSNGRMAIIKEDGWTGALVKIQEDPEPRGGTILRFADEPWNKDVVERHAAFCGMEVIVDNKRCAREVFVSDEAAHHPELGCRIEVRSSDKLDEWHRANRRDRYCYATVLVNFHGQVVAFDHHAVSEQGLNYLVDLTGEPTSIRLMLPARTRLVENEAYKQLLAALELEAYRHIQRRGHHTLPYKEYLRGKELGINLPEAKPTYTVGLLSYGDPPEPVEVTMPKDFPLAKCYRFDPNFKDGMESDETNAHLLAALGTFEEPFVPVDIRACYNGYSWAKLPTIQKVGVEVGKELLSQWLWSGKLSCMDSLKITARTSDGKTFSSTVCMAKSPTPAPEGPTWLEDLILVTPGAQQRLNSSEIWYHLGGWYDEGDTYDTQELAFSEDLERFWTNLIGPDEQLRRDFVRPTEGLKDSWQRITITPDGTVTLHFTDGTSKTLQSPAAKLAE